MNLQVTLLIIGVFILIAVFLISRRFDVIGTERNRSDSSGQRDKYEPNLNSSSLDNPELDSFETFNSDFQDTYESSLVEESYDGESTEDNVVAGYAESGGVSDINLSECEIADNSSVDYESEYNLELDEQAAQFEAHINESLDQSSMNEDDEPLEDSDEILGLKPLPAEEQLSFEEKESLPIQNEIPVISEFIPDSEFAEPEEDDNLIQDFKFIVQNEELSEPEYAPLIEETERPAPEAMDIEGFEKLSQIDYWVKITGDRDISRESIFALYQSLSSELTMTHSIFGLKVPENSWCDLIGESEDTRFSDLVLTIQLADQRGAVQEEELDRFAHLVNTLSEKTGRQYAFMAPLESAKQQARAIHEFYLYFDKVYVVNVRPQTDEVFYGSSIERAARQLGLEKSDRNLFDRYKLLGKSRVCLYSLANMTDTGQFDFENMGDIRTRGVTFFTKPAINRSPGAVFAEMVDTAKAFASRIKGDIVAPGFEDLSQDDVEKIRKSITTIEDKMTELGISPGSDEAMRIF